MTRRRAYGTIAAMLAFLVVMLAAAPGCGPAAPAGEDGTPDNPFATAVAPTPTLPAGTADDKSRWDGTGLPPPPIRTRMERQYPNLVSNLISAIATHEAATAHDRVARTSESSGQPPPTLELITLSIITDTPERADDLRRFLENNGASNITCGKGSGDDVIQGGCGADVPVSLLRRLAEQPDVIRIDEVRIQRPASGLRLPSSQQLLADADGATASRLLGL